MENEHFQKLVSANEPNDGWNIYDWKKPSLAVVATGDDEDGWIMWTVGPHVKFDIDEVGLSRRLGDLGIDKDAPAGISIWEGKIKTSTSYEGEQDSWLEGSFREPTEEEWSMIRQGKCPWNDDLWLKDGSKIVDLPPEGT